MAILALNIALVGESDLEEFAKYANRLLADKYPHTFRFDVLTPHISLLQLYVEQDRILALTAALEALASERSRCPGLLIIDVEEGPDAGVNSLKLPRFVFDNSDQLKLLHAEICERLSPFAIPLDKLESLSLTRAFATTIGGVNQDSIDYVKNFMAQKTKAEFVPRMTLGCAPLRAVNEMQGKVRKHITERIYEGDSIAIFHMANYCTANRLIASVPLMTADKILHDTHPRKQPAFKQEWFQQSM